MTVFLIIFIGFLLLLQILGFVYFCRQIYYFLHASRVGLINSNLTHISKTLDSIFASIPNFEQYNFVELGSGLGTVTRHIAKVYPFQKFLTVELDWINYTIAKAWNKLSGLEVDAINIDLFEFSMPKHSVVYCYLFPKILNALVAKNYFQDCYVISLTFEIDDKTPLAIYPIKGFQKQLIVYKFN